MSLPEPRASADASLRPFWLSHHRTEERHRTYRLGQVQVCARCLGTYPTLLLAIAAQLWAGASLSWRFDGAWALGLLMPATFDWVWGRFVPRAGSNALRTATGVLLGLALGRTLYVHLHRPLPFWLVAQGVVVTGAVLFVILARRRAG
jgi:uncharacterized membrane protein